MRIFKFWAQHTAALTLDDITQVSKAYGGSNISLAEAKKAAVQKLLKVQQVINGQLRKDQDYEADIVEEIITELDNHNIVTRNRYGALVLNSTNTLFIDVDHHNKSLIDLLFRRSWTLKKLMLTRIEKKMAKSAYAQLGFRVYETCKGYRILVTNATFDPQSRQSDAIMKDFRADTLYQALCLKQNCYRARLTPKPYRIEQRKIRVVFPNRNAAQQEAHMAWVQEYEQASQHFSTCRLVKQQGRVRTTTVSRYHDTFTGAYKRYPLA